MKTTPRNPLPLLLCLCLFLSACDSFFPSPSHPGSDQPGGSQAMPEAPQPTLPPADNPAADDAPSGSQPAANPGGGLLKPVRFSNTGASAYTVSVWEYTPLDPAASSTPSDASTVASPGGNTSSALSLPLGTYTWCYHWELGDLDSDGNIDYAHAFDARQVRLDPSSPDDLELAQVVTLSAPTGAGDLPGTCLEAVAPTARVAPRAALPNGELLFSDGGSAAGMFGPEYMDFAYAGSQATLTANAPGFVLPAMISGQSFGNAAIEVDFTAYSGNGSQLCIIFRSDDVDGGLASYNILALIPSSRTLEFAVWQEGWTQSLVLPIADPAVSLATPIHLRLEARGSEYVAFINGVFAAGILDSQITSAGIIGLSITSDAAPASFSFANLAVYALP